MKKLIALASISMALNIHAQNLIANSSFDANTDHWSNSDLSEMWISNDGAPLSGNGSLKFETNFNNGGSIWMESDFMPVEFDYNYILGASFKQPANSMANYLYMTVYWFDVNQEFIGEYPYLGIEPTFNVSSTDTWLDYNGQFISLIEGSKFAKVYLWIGTQADAMGVSSALFDDILFFQDTVFKSNFD